MVSNDPDPLKIGLVPVLAAIGDNYRCALVFSGPLDTQNNPSGFTARLTAYDTNGDLKTGALDDTGSPVNPEAAPSQISMTFLEPTDAPELASPGIVFDNSLGHVLAAGGSIVASGTVGGIDIGVE